MTHRIFSYHVVKNARGLTQYSGQLLPHLHVLPTRLTRLQLQLRVRVLLPLPRSDVQHTVAAVDQQLLLLTVGERRVGPAIALLLGGGGGVAVDARAGVGGFLADGLVGVGLWDDVFEELEVVVCGDGVCWGLLGVLWDDRARKRGEGAGIKGCFERRHKGGLGGGGGVGLRKGCGCT